MEILLTSLRQVLPATLQRPRATTAAVTVLLRIASYWLHAEKGTGTYPEHTPKGGKWLIFAPAPQIDALWAKIARATERGLLGGMAKVSTAKPNPNAANPKKHVICVYIYDWTDEADVWRIREALRDLGITSKIAYKADEDTFAGRYEKRGHRRIAKCWG